MYEPPVTFPTIPVAVLVVTAPPYGPEVDLRAYDWFPLFRRRLFASRFHRLASPEEWRAGFILWIKSWDECPAGSLPADDRELYALAELRDNREWRRVKKWALHGWELRDDGRLYHPVVTEVTIKAWEQKEANRHRTAAATEARIRHRDDQRNVQRDEIPPSDSPPGPDLDQTRPSPPKSPPSSRRRGGLVLQNGEDKGSRGPVRAVDPKLIGHGDFCQCANCVRWAKAKGDTR